MSNKILAFAAIATLAAVLIFSVQPSNPAMTEFEQFKATHQRNYKSLSEEEYRKSIFLVNLAKIAAHNADSTQTYTLKVTQFADMTQEEFAEIYLQTRLNEKFSDISNARTMNFPDKVGDIDWVAQGKVSRVKNQGGCGSCWAFSATGAIESALRLASRSDEVSEQQLVDCSRAYGNQGCNGGWMDSAFSYVKDHGLVSEDAYSYTARDGACRIDSGPIKISGFIDVPGCDNLANALNGRPISVAVDASNWSLYGGGVFNNCGTGINHGVLAVGATGAWWKIKNSWGQGWGEGGFIRLAPGNTCAVCGYGSYPTL